MRGRRQARSTGPPSCDPSPIGACTIARKGRIENTAPAFLAAIDKGYGIECDLQAAKDGTPMVFHDEKLDRLVGVPGRIAAQLPASLVRLRYRRQDTHILTFAEFLDLVGGRVPLLVEVKVNGSAPRQQLPRQDRAPGQSLQRPDRAHVLQCATSLPSLGRLAPTVPRGLVVGSHKLHPSWWAAPSAANKSRILTKTARLGSRPALPSSPSTCACSAARVPG